MPTSRKMHIVKRFIIGKSPESPLGLLLGQTNLLASAAGIK
jgi:hypothetical protein